MLKHIYFHLLFSKNPEFLIFVTADTNEKSGEF